MNPVPFLAEFSVGNLGVAALAIVGLVIVVFIFLGIWASRYTKVGPNQVLVVSGRQYKMQEQDGADQGQRR